MMERAFRFGRDRHLIGIAGLPGPNAEGLGVIVLNAGLVHRIGPFRMSVDMTRRFNAMGYPTLRFDFSTVGDSGASTGQQSRAQQIHADVADAMALLRQHGGCQRFVLVGLCSGAQNAHAVAKLDEHVAGAAFLDGYAYRTFGYRVRHYLPKLFSLTRWRRRLARDNDEPGTAAPKEAVFRVEPIPQQVVRDDFAGMLKRGQRLCLVYTGGINNFFNHARQFRECFGAIVSDPAVSTRYVGEADHTYVLAGDRLRLIDHLEAWLRSNFPVTQIGPSP